MNGGFSSKPCLMTPVPVYPEGLVPETLVVTQQVMVGQVVVFDDDPIPQGELPSGYD